MAFIKWDDSLSVNVKEIDEQHKKLVDLINKLTDAMSAGKAKQILGNILNELASYTVIHFKTEEKYFDKFKYPFTISHKKEHNDFIKKINDFKRDFESGKALLSVEIMKFLKDWLIKHIKGSDKKYSEFFNKHGLK